MRVALDGTRTALLFLIASFAKICFYSSANFFIFRGCSNDQEVFHEFSSKIEEVTYKAAERISRKLYPKCSMDEAWTLGNISIFEECTTEISASNRRIKSILSKLPVFAQSNNLTISLQAEFHN